MTSRVKQDDVPRATAALVGGVGIATIATVGYATPGEDWVTALMGPVAAAVLQVVLYAALLVGVLGVTARYATALGRVGRVALYGLAAAFAGLTLTFLLDVFLREDSVLESVIATVAFAGHFLFATPLGVSLWRRTDASRAAALLLAVTVPMLGVTVLLAALELPAHPALGEVPVTLGVAVLGLQRLRQGVAPPPRPQVSS